MKTIRVLSAALLGAGATAVLLRIEMRQPHVEQSKALMEQGKPSIIRVYDSRDRQLPVGSAEAERILRGRYNLVIVP